MAKSVSTFDMLFTGERAEKTIMDGGEIPTRSSLSILSKGGHDHCMVVVQATRVDETDSEVHETT